MVKMLRFDPHEIAAMRVRRAIQAGHRRRSPVRGFGRGRRGRAPHGGRETDRRRTPRSPGVRCSSRLRRIQGGHSHGGREDRPGGRDLGAGQCRASGESASSLARTSATTWSRSWHARAAALRARGIPCPAGGRAADRQQGPRQDRPGVQEYRKSQENPDITRLYDDFYEEPNSHLAHQLLHTSYSPFQDKTSVPPTMPIN